MTARYAEFVYVQAAYSAQMPGSPASRGLPSSVPGTSRALVQAHRARRVAAELADDPMVAAVDPVLAAMVEAVQP